jgi:oligopeptide/dipeptide ABC transporter ATP-binding protein
MSPDRHPAALAVRDLRVEMRTRDGIVHPVDGVSFDIRRGRTLGLAGESGCGKTLTALALMRLLPRGRARISGGSVLWSNGDGEPVDLATVGEQEVRRMRGRRLAMIFQDPAAALNPVFTVGEQIAEVSRLHLGLSRGKAMQQAARLLSRVGIADAARRAREYPHQFSGGMQQRAMLAMALAGEPAILIADEPTTALDVTVQAQIVDLLRGIQSAGGMGMLWVTHDLGVLAQVADEICVMYAGRIVERAPTRELFSHPLHPYTQALLACVPRLHRPAGGSGIPGSVPTPTDVPPGCRFHPRCALSRRRAAEAGAALSIEGPSGRVLRHCVDEIPVLRQARPEHWIACGEVAS